LVNERSRHYGFDGFGELILERVPIFDFRFIPFDGSARGLDALGLCGLRQSLLEIPSQAGSPPLKTIQRAKRQRKKNEQILEETFHFSLSLK